MIGYTVQKNKLTMSEEDNEDPAPLRSSLKKSSPKETKKKKHSRHSLRFQSEPPSMAALFSPDSTGGGGGLEEEAEGHLLRVLEERRARAKYKDGDWDPSVEGEEPPLRRVSFVGAAMFSPTQNEEKGEQVASDARRRFQNLAFKVREMRSSRNLNVDEPPSEELSQLNQNPSGEDEEPGNERDETCLKELEARILRLASLRFHKTIRIQTWLSVLQWL